MSISFVLTSICSVWVMFRYDAGIEWMRLINEVFNNRLKFGNRSLILYGISMFGKKNMEWLGTDWIRLEIKCKDLFMGR